MATLREAGEAEKFASGYGWLVVVGRTIAIGSGLREREEYALSIV